MKATTLLTIAVAISFGLQMPSTFAQGFDSGSDGSMGALTVNTLTNLTLPPDGKLHFTTITVNPGGRLRFIRNALNTPVYLLATGDVLLATAQAAEGVIDVSGGAATTPTGGAGGPGGFDGGSPSGSGYGPGGGQSGTASGGADNAGGGSYATQASGSSTNKGSIYGSRLLVPVVGGSGGGGTPDGGGVGGGGGGGAILIASNTRIEVRGNAAIQSVGAGDASGAGGGSGGGIRLVAPVVTGDGNLQVGGTRGGGDGRIRVDTIDRGGLAFIVTGGTGGSSWSIGSFMTVFPPGNPRLDIIEAAGTTIPQGTNAPVVINLPFGSDTNRTVTVQARNFGGTVTIEVVLTPQTGQAIKIQTQIDNTTVNPATATVPVGFPLNTPVAVNAWRR